MLDNKQIAKILKNYHILKSSIPSMERNIDNYAAVGSRDIKKTVLQHLDKIDSMFYPLAVAIKKCKLVEHLLKKIDYDDRTALLKVIAFSVPFKLCLSKPPFKTRSALINAVNRAFRTFAKYAMGTTLDEQPKTLPNEKNGEEGQAND